MPRSEPSDCFPRSYAPATRPRSGQLWKLVLPDAPEAPEAVRPLVGPALSVRHRETAFRSPRRGETGQMCELSPSLEWGPFGNNLQLLRIEFTTFGCGGSINLRLTCCALNITKQG